MLGFCFAVNLVHQEHEKIKLTCETRKYISLWVERIQEQLKTSLIETKNFLTKNLDTVKYVEEFVKRMAILDRLRQQNLYSVLPELKQLGG